MANPEHVDILKQGVKFWNEWREENPEVRPDLQGVELRGVELRRANFHGVDFYHADLQHADLSITNLQHSNLQHSDLQHVDLQHANLQHANLQHTNLQKSNLHYTILIRANLKGAKLKRATLSYADLQEANLQEVNLQEANLKNANLQSAILKRANLQATLLNLTFIGSTHFSELDLSKVIGLDHCTHQHPSTLGTDTLINSKGGIPITFLKGCGLSDWEIESAKLYQPNLSNQEIIDINYRIIDIRMTQAIQISPLFISYSHADAAFVDKIGEALTEKGVRYWRDIRDAKAGKLEKQVDQAMRLNPIVLIVLSETSTNSDWVEFEAGKARKLEKELGRDVLCPVAIDDSWKDCDWPGRLRTQIENYNILPFNGWEDQAVFDRMFAKLLGGLDLFYKK